MSALDIVGIYLEGDVVATDYQYTIRCRHVYYDLVRNKAYAADAVLRTVDRKGQLLVARAAEMQQVAGRQWRVGESTLSNSEFFVPHLSVGVSRATVTQTAAGDSFVIADDVTGRMGRIPFFWMPTVQGSLDRLPIKGVQLGYGDPEGTVFGVELDPFVLLGLKPEPGLDATLEAGVQSEYGVNADLRMKGDAGGAWNADFFGVYDFLNPEQTANAGFVTSANEWRGMVTADWVLQSSPDADTKLQLGVQSDPTLVSIFRPDDYQERRPYETAAWTTSSTDNSIIDFGASISANDWVSTMWQLASRPYTAEKYPELNYRRFGDRILGSTVTWSSEYSGSLMQLNLQDTDSEEIGADRRQRSTQRGVVRGGLVQLQHPETGAPKMGDRGQVAPLGGRQGQQFVAERQAVGGGIVERTEVEAELRGQWLHRGGVGAREARQVLLREALRPDGARREDDFPTLDDEFPRAVGRQLVDAAGVREPRGEVQRDGTEDLLAARRGPTVGRAPELGQQGFADRDARRRGLMRLREPRNRLRAPARRTMVRDQVGLEIGLEGTAERGVAGDQALVGRPAAAGPGGGEAGDQADPSKGALRHRRKRN